MLLIYKMPRNHLGNCYVNYSEPIDLNTFVNENKDLKFKDRAMKLTKDLLYYQLQQQPITKNSVISASILMHQKPVISIRKI